LKVDTSGIQLDHERLDVYQLARELARVGNTVVQQVPSGRADLIDQFRRTTLSIPLNIAEGGGEYAPKEKARFYRIAKRSATECAGVLDHMVDLNLLHPAEIEGTKTLLRRIISALVKLILSTEKLTQPRPPSATAPARDRQRVRAPAT
jgi:four helix bundle protein